MRMIGGFGPNPKGSAAVQSATLPPTTHNKPSDTHWVVRENAEKAASSRGIRLKRVKKSPRVNANIMRGRRPNLSPSRNFPIAAVKGTPQFALPAGISAFNFPSIDKIHSTASECNPPVGSLRLANTLVGKSFKALDTTPWAVALYLRILFTLLKTCVGSRVTNERKAPDCG